MSLILGFVSAVNYKPILSDSLKYGVESTGLFSVCLAISTWKYKWLFLIPIGIQIANHYQVVNRLAHLTGE
jgi:hypothetical protein